MSKEHEAAQSLSRVKSTPGETKNPNRGDSTSTRKRKKSAEIPKPGSTGSNCHQSTLAKGVEAAWSLPHAKSTSVEIKNANSNGSISTKRRKKSAEVLKPGPTGSSSRQSMVAEQIDALLSLLSENSTSGAIKNADSSGSISTKKRKKSAEGLKPVLTGSSSRQSTLVVRPKKRSCNVITHFRHGQAGVEPEHNHSA